MLKDTPNPLLRTKILVEKFRILPTKGLTNYTKCDRMYILGVVGFAIDFEVLLQVYLDCGTLQL